MIDLTGKTALVTGGSRGIGREVCLLLAKAGANVTLGFRNDESAAHSVVEQIRLGGKHAVAVAGDVSKRDTFERLFQEARAAFGQIHIVVGNAGIWKRAVYVSISHCVCLSQCAWITLSVSMCVCLSGCVYVCLCVSPTVSLYVCLSQRVCQCQIACLCVSLRMCLSQCVCPV